MLLQVSLRGCLFLLSYFKIEEEFQSLLRCQLCSWMNFLWNQFWQGVDHFKKIQYADGITYGELFLENEYINTPLKENSYYLDFHATSLMLYLFNFFWVTGIYDTEHRNLILEFTMCKYFSKIFFSLLVLNVMIKLLYYVCTKMVSFCKSTPLSIFNKVRNKMRRWIVLVYQTKGRLEA